MLDSNLLDTLIAVWELPTFKQMWQRRYYCLATASKQQLLGKVSKQRLLGKVSKQRLLGKVSKQQLLDEAYNNTDSDMFSICPTLGYIRRYSYSSSSVFKVLQSSLFLLLLSNSSNSS
jgi:PIN domain nuclease of toxin-antitoxin system